MALAGGGNPYGAKPSAAAPGYKVHLTFREGDRRIRAFEVWHVPSQRLIHSEDGMWMEMTAAGFAALRRVARDVRPFPASEGPVAAAAPPSAPPPAARTPTPAADDGGVAWWVVTALAAAVAGAIALLARRRTGRRPVVEVPAP